MICNRDYCLCLQGWAEGGTFMSQGNTAVPAQAQEQEEEEACPIGEVLDHIAGKWSIGIIAAAAAGTVRFTELERAIAGISRRMLTASWNATACSSGPCTRPCHPRSNTASPPSPASSASHSQPSLRGRNDTAAPSPQPAPPTTAGPATQRADWPPPAKRSSRVWSAARP